MKTRKRECNALSQHFRVESVTDAKHYYSLKLYTDYVSGSGYAIVFITGCPNDTRKEVEGNVPEVEVSWIPPIGKIITSEGEQDAVSCQPPMHNPGDLFTVGITPVIYVYGSDGGCDFYERCTFRVIVEVGMYVDQSFP